MLLSIDISDTDRDLGTCISTILVSSAFLPFLLIELKEYCYELKMLNYFKIWFGLSFLGKLFRFEVFFIG